MSSENFVTPGGVGKPRLSITMLGMLCRCGIQFQRRYGYRFGVWHCEEKIAPGVAAAVGISVHHGVEQNLRCKMDTGTLLHPDQLSSIVDESIREVWDAGLLLKEAEAANVPKTRGDSIDKAIALAALHHRVLAPGIDPLALEERFVIPLDHYPVDLSGVKDIRTERAIRDTKTSGKSPGQNAAYTMQMGMYALSEVSARGKLPEEVFVDYLVSTKEPKVEVRDAKPDMVWIDPLLRRIERFIEIIEAVRAGKQAFTPADPESWVCSTNYCGYHQTCQFRSAN